VVAVDGSQLATDRHYALSCYLINVGSALLRYGDRADCTLLSKPRLYYDEVDSYVVDPTDPDRRAPVEGRCFTLAATWRSAAPWPALPRRYR